MSNIKQDTGDKDILYRRRHGKVKQGVVVDYLENEDGDQAHVIYDPAGRVVAQEGDEKLLDHFEPGEGLDEHFEKYHEHYVEHMEGYPP